MMHMKVGEVKGELVAPHFAQVQECRGKERTFGVYPPCSTFCNKGKEHVGKRLVD
jgi:hypothetical protein